MKLFHKEHNVFTKATITLFVFTLVSGCATRPSPEPVRAGNCPPLFSGNCPPLPPPPMPENGYTWRELAAHAIAASPDHAAILADARAEYFRHKAKTDLQDLRLMLDYTFRATDSSGHDWNKSGTERYQTGDATRDRYGAALRFYFPNPFVDKHILRTGDAARRETEASADELKRQIARAVYELVQEILFAQRALELLAQREQVLTDWAAHLKERQDARVATQADVLALELQRIRLQAAIQQKQLAARAAWTSLDRLVNISHPYDEALKLDPQPHDWATLLDSLTFVQGLTEAVRARSPELAAARAAYDKARATLDTAKARQIPWLAYAQAGYAARDTDATAYRSDGRYSTSHNDSDEWRLRIAVDLPVFAWMSSEKKAAAASMEAAQLREAALRQRIRDDITDTVESLRGAVALLDEYRAALAAVPEPTRDALPDPDAFYKLTDARLAAAEHALAAELHCALLYGRLLDALP